MTSTSDDGMQVWVDGRLVPDNSGDHPAVTKSATVNYATGGFQDILVRYYENSGYAVAKLAITSANKLPAPIVSVPVLGARFNPGQQLGAVGSATDPEDGTLSGNSLQWTVILHQCPPTPAGVTDVCHTHPYD